MGTFFHKLKKVKSQETPRNWAFLDIEANIEKISDTIEQHTCKLGWCCYVRKASKGKESKEIWFSFKDTTFLWSKLLSEAEVDRKLVVIGYNVGYDFRLARGFLELAFRGYDQKKIYCKGVVTIISFVKGKHTILVIDAMNFFNGKLANWGTMLGIPKLSVDFDTVDNKTLLIYCKRDVLILKKLIESWLEFLTDNQFGHFCITRASQSMIAFRKKFMYQDIYIHGDREGNSIERESYYGGRTECFFIGTPKGKRFWKVDINSMYPHIMRNLEVPWRFRGIRKDVSLSALNGKLHKLGWIAKVTVKTDEPAYPIKIQGKLCYPIGTFTTTLADPELRYAHEHNHLLTIHKLAVYDKALQFDLYVDELYKLRQQYKLSGNIIYEQMVKYMLNSLYGKFGQYTEDWIPVETTELYNDGEHMMFNIDTGEQYRIIVIAGKSWRIAEKVESINSFPAISSYITSAARVMLWGLIKQAGIGNVFYTDTDSLILNSKGYANLKEHLNNTELGMLKLEYATKKLIIRGPKDYETDTEKHIKGISPDAIEIKPGVFIQTQWQGLRGALAIGNLDKVVLTKVTKTLRRIYDKGVVAQSGYVSPFSLDGL